MANTNGKRDENRGVVVLGVDNVTGETRPVRVDAEGRVMMMYVYSDYTPNPHTRIAIDENREYCGLAVTDTDTAQTIETGMPMGLLLSLTYTDEIEIPAENETEEIRPLLADPTNLYLLVDSEEVPQEITTGQSMGLLLALTYTN